MTILPEPVTAPGRVLSTLNADGSRRWIRPKPSSGGFWHARRTVAYTLMLVFFLIPYLRVGGKPAILIDLPARRFTLLGTTFLPTETVLFMLLLLVVAVVVLLVTALWGRVWCGWACPQTVYMEFLFRPVERWLEGGWRASQRMDRRRGFHPRRLLKNTIYLGFALFLAHTFLAYFVGVDELAHWMRRSPAEHPTSFLVVLFTTGLVLADFGWFREQTCLVACPYGRLQSVLLDRHSLIVGYDPGRGEPRRKGVRDRPADAGDCIDCRMCVLTCPTGIDIREGLQMECIHCTQCMDACDFVMGRIGKPPGLIRYGSSEELAGRRAGRFRVRLAIYPAALVACGALLVWGLSIRTHAEVTLLRGLGPPFTRAADGSVINQVRIKLANRADDDRAYGIALEQAQDARLIAPMNPLPVAAGAMRTTSVFVVLPASGFRGGERAVRFRISDADRWSESFPYRLVGPEDPEGRR
jgi:cytochrome c oxidase accessory protein FixG